MWVTRHELDFIKGMVAGKFIKRSPAVNEETLIKNYIKCAEHRKMNGITPDIDWDLCIGCAHGLLQEV